MWDEALCFQNRTCCAYSLSSVNETVFTQPILQPASWYCTYLNLDAKLLRIYTDLPLIYAAALVFAAVAVGAIFTGILDSESGS